MCQKHRWHAEECGDNQENPAEECDDNTQEVCGGVRPVSLFSFAFASPITSAANPVNKFSNSANIIFVGVAMETARISRIGLNIKYHVGEVVCFRSDVKPQYASME